MVLKINSLLFLALLALLLLSTSLVEAVRKRKWTTLSPVFRDGMVLDRHGAKVFGEIGKSDQVTVRVVQQNGDVSYSVPARANGKTQLWVAELKDHSDTSNGELFDVFVESTRGRRITLKNVVFGDVFFCSGQSNMALALDYTFQKQFLQLEMETGALDDRIKVFSLNGRDIYPETGHSKNPQNTLRMEPFTDGWQNPASLLATNKLGKTSAVCLGFAYHLAKKIDSVPIGIIVSAYGSSNIEAWMDKRETRRCKNTLKTGGMELPLGHLFNEMVFPFVNMKIRGVIFYQGENNVKNPGFPGSKPEGYACLLPLLIANWRSAWKDDQLFFGIVSLAPGPLSANKYQIPRVRFAQIGAAVDDPFTRVIHAYDLPDPFPEEDTCKNSGCCPDIGQFDFNPARQCTVRSCNDPIDGPWCSYYTEWLSSAVHSRLKFRLSARIAATVASALYESEAEEAFSPKFSTCALTESKNKIDITFRTGTQALKIVDPLVPNKAIEICTEDAALCQCPFWQRKGSSWLCIGGPKAKVKSQPEWVPLTTSIKLTSPNTITLNLPENTQVFAIRYAWIENPCCDKSTNHFKVGTSPCPPQNCQILTTNTASLPPDPFFLVLDQTKSSCKHI